MAGDWIKIEKSTLDKPEIMAIASKLSLSHELVFAKCVKLWSWMDTHSSDGFCKGVNVSWVDVFVQVPGFGQAMLDVGWLRDRSGALEFPNFNRHCGDTAKSRAASFKRQIKHREKRKNGQIPGTLRRHVLERDRDTCVYCGWNPSKGTSPNDPQLDTLSIDHVVPVCAGGPTTKDNLVTACMRCNIAKNGRSLEESGFALKYVTDKCNEEVLQKRDTSSLISSPSFVPPSLEEVRNYCAQRNSPIDPEQFHAHYTANGWVQGHRNKPIRDWKAAVITWERKRKEHGSEPFAPRKESIAEKIARLSK